MSIIDMLGNLIIFLIVVATIGLAVGSMKGDLVWPMIASCPEALFSIMDIYSQAGQVSNLDRQIQNIWDCSIGVMLFMALPGITISWAITKHIT